ncbi:MFS transporter [Acanthopleuribacter pedis]|uniref:MFS transporter n=1 Tax=Acanthopleuribacter pedis TaxID=442870 RepID=A0A8J7QDN6_9BACT|nr:MFS transporter [Acanthopleuribacter pedis]MBO1321874.1 MFS transporter [Acanthopleuribacter pedis]
MGTTLLSLTALLLSFTVLMIGHGLGNTVLGIRATLEGFPSWVMGLITSGYFFGLLIGTRIAVKLIQAVGKIRVFAAFASAASSVTLLNVLFINEVTWVLSRVVYGVSLATLFIVIEGWINAHADPKNRGQVLSLYMVLNFLGLACGQMLLFAADPASFELFAGVSILISISLVPLTLSQSKEPRLAQSEAFGLGRLYQISPLATIGCLCNGLTMGSFWGLSSVYYTTVGLPADHVATILSISFFGGLLFQWPIGYCSDLVDRRFTITVVLFGSSFICLCFVLFIGNQIIGITPFLMLVAFLFGGFGYTLYSLYIALANDFLEPHQAVKASAGLLGFHAIGAIVGPTCASFMMTLLGGSGLFVFIGSINVALALFAYKQLLQGRAIPAATHESFVSMPKTSPAILELDPRSHDPSGLNHTED